MVRFNGFLMFNILWRDKQRFLANLFLNSIFSLKDSEKVNVQLHVKVKILLLVHKEIF